MNRSFVSPGQAGHSSEVPHVSTPGNGRIEMDLVAQRILKLAEIAMLDHMEALARSQADGFAGFEGRNDGRRMCPGN